MAVSSECIPPTWWQNWRRSVALAAVAVLMTLAWLSTIEERDNAYQLLTAYEAMADSSSTANVRTDAHGIIQGWSVGAVKMFGLTIEQAVGSDLSPIIPIDMRASHRRHFDQAAQRGGIGRDKLVISCRAVGASGPIDVEITIRSALDRNEQPLFLATIDYAQNVHRQDLTMR